MSEGPFSRDAGHIFMLYILLHTVLAVEFVVVLWNRVYNLCTLYVLKGGDRG